MNTTPAHLAPMEGVSEWPFRLFMAIVGGMKESTTPFIRVTDTYPPKQFPWELLEDRHLGLYRVNVQLMASSARRFLDIAKPIIDDIPFVELNCGCPSPKVYKHKAGSQILADQKHFREFVRTITSELPAGKLAVKIRLGVDLDSEVFSLLDQISDLPLRKLTIHGRTKKKRYLGSANWGLIHYAAERMPFAVVGSGDIVDLQTHLARTSRSHLESVIIGRGALRNPWVFQEVNDKRKPHLTKQVVKEALSCFYLLHHLKFVGLGPLQIADHLEFNVNDCLHSWQQNRAKLLSLLDHSEKFPHCRISLGRTKMLWTYFKDHVAEDPKGAATMLRRLSFEEFIDTFESSISCVDDKRESEREFFLGRDAMPSPMLNLSETNEGRVYGSP